MGNALKIGNKACIHPLQKDGYAGWWCGVDVGVLYMTATWKPQEKVMMSTAASLPSVVKPRFIDPVGERTKLQKVDAR
jgi:hypothetical protein